MLSLFTWLIFWLLPLFFSCPPRVEAYPSRCFVSDRKSFPPANGYLLKGVWSKSLLLALMLLISSDLRIFSNSFKLDRVPWMLFFPPEVYMNIGRVYDPSTKILTISIWFSMLLYLTIFSIFYEEILFTILSRLLS